MALDKVLIGERIRKVREEVLHESRKSFAFRCNLEDRYIAQVERGEFLFSLKNLDIIARTAGVSTDYILYGIDNGKMSSAKSRLHTIIDMYDDERASAVFKCVTILETYFSKQFGLK